MRSATLVPLAHVFGFLGINPWKAAQIDYANRSATASMSPDSCMCLFQEGYHFGKLSRNDFAHALSRAEHLFYTWTRTRPGFFYTEGEEQDFVQPHKGIYTKFGTYKSVTIDNNGFQFFGAVSEEVLDDEAALTKLDGGSNILDLFTASVPVDDEVEAKQIKVYFSNADRLVYYEQHGWEIKPVHVEIDDSGGDGNHLALISIPAYLCLRPVLEAQGKCWPHHISSYVDTIRVSQINIDTCNQGSFITRMSYGDCGGVPCQVVESPACFEYLPRSNEASPAPMQCIEGVLTPYTFTKWADRVKINYVSGLIDKYTWKPQIIYHNIISMMTAALLECDQDACNCPTCATQRLKHYQQGTRIKIAEGFSTDSTGDQWLPAFSWNLLDQLEGLPPRVGLMEAWHMLKDLRSAWF